MASAALPALRDAYLEFLTYSDPLADAPTFRFLELSVREKDKQIADLNRRLTEMSTDGAGAEAVSRQWVGDFADQLKMLGGIGTDRAPVDRVITRLKSLHEIDPERYTAPSLVRQHCEELVQRIVAQASSEEKRAITDPANAVIQRATALAGT